MAIPIMGKTVCHLCGGVIGKVEDVNNQWGAFEIKLDHGAVEDGSEITSALRREDGVHVVLIGYLGP